MLGLSLRVARVEVLVGVERQLLCQFGRLALVLAPFLALDARFGQKAGVERQFTSSILGQSMDYYTFLESPGCLLSNEIGSVPFRIL